MDYKLIGYFFGNVVLPLAMVMYVILHFRNDKNIYLYSGVMIVLFLFTSSWFVVISGLVLIGLNNAIIWAKEKRYGRKEDN